MPRQPNGRQQLLDAARAELIASNGVLELGALTRRAGLSTGALYHHFKSKSGMLAALYGEFYEGLLEAIADRHLDPDADWAKRERERTFRFVDYHFAEPLTGILLRRAENDQQLADLEATYLHSIRQNAAKNIRRGQRSGQLPKHLDAESAAAFVIGGLRQAMTHELRTNGTPNVDEVAERLWNLTSGALGIR